MDRKKVSEAYSSFLLETFVEFLSRVRGYQKKRKKAPLKCRTVFGILMILRRKTVG